MPADGLPTTHTELLDALPDWAWTARDRSKTMRLIAARQAAQRRFRRPPDETDLDTPAD